MTGPIFGKLPLGDAKLVPLKDRYSFDRSDIF